MLSFDFTLTDQNDEEFDVTVEYNPGYFQRGCRSGHPDNWTPDEGEDPEITSVKDIDGKEIMDTLDEKTMRKLTERAWEDQNMYPEPDYDDRDDYPDDWDDRAADEAADRYERGLGL